MFHGNRRYRKAVRSPRQYPVRSRRSITIVSLLYCTATSRYSLYQSLTGHQSSPHTPLALPELLGFTMAQRPSFMIYIGYHPSALQRPFFHFKLSRIFTMHPDCQKNDSPGPLPPSLTSANAGIWQIIYDRGTGSSWAQAFSKLKQTFLDRSLVRLLLDIYHLAPDLLFLCTACHLIDGIESACTFYYSTRLISSVSCQRYGAPIG
jgi:hypothetical protein